MAIILNGVTLNPHMLWPERYGYSPVLQEVKRTLAAKQVIYTATAQAGQPITLTAIEDQGWLTLAQVQAVQSIAEVAAQQMTLVVGGESFTVSFRHHEPPAVDMAPLIPRAVPLAGDYFTGEIKLITV